MQCAVAHDDVHLVAVLLVIVQAVVLDTCRNALRLQPLYVRNHHRGGQEGVFTHIFEVTTVERSAQDVHSRTQYHILSPIESLLSESFAIDARHLGIPAGCQTGECRKSHAGVVGLPGLVPFVPKNIGSDTVRTVIGPEIGEAKTGNSSRRELALGMYHTNLLLQSHA